MHKNNMRGNRKQRSTYRISIIGTGGVLGVEDLVPPGVKKAKVLHQATVTCISEKAEVYFLSSEDFFGSFYRHMR
jgi:hypothetical protein